jgi:hypothetical protein
VTLQTALSQVALTAGISESDNFVTSKNKDHRLLVGLANEIAQALASESEFPELTRTASITTVVGVTAYALPLDFHTPIHGTFRDQGFIDYLNGPVSEIEWSYITQANYPAHSPYSYRISGASTKQLEIYPSPGSASEIRFQYYSSNVALPKAWQSVTSYSEGDLVSVGTLIYLCISAGTSSTTAPSHTEGDAMEGDVLWRVSPQRYQYFKSKDDVCALGDLILQLGVAYRYAEENGAVWQPHQQRYLKEINTRKAALSGAPVLSRVPGQGRLSVNRYRGIVTVQ